MSDSGIVTFDYPTWSGQYPELAASVNGPQAQGYFNQACLYLDNTASSQVQPATPGGRRETILYMLTSHMAALLAAIGGNEPTPLVGRLSNVTEGSVSIQTEMLAPMSAQWFNQTKYGAMAYQALAPYRTALYVPAPQVPLAAQSYPGAGGGFGPFDGIMPFNGGFPWPR